MAKGSAAPRFDREAVLWSYSTVSFVEIVQLISVDSNFKQKLFVALVFLVVVLFIAVEIYFMVLCLCQTASPFLNLRLQLHK